MLEIDIQNTLSALTESIGMKALDITPIAASGSSRQYFRITTSNGSVIGTYNANVEENEAFFYLTSHFGEKGLPVPQLLAINGERNCYLQSDQGDDTLFRFVQQSLLSGKYNDQTVKLFQQTLEALVRFQTEGHEGLDYSKVYPTPCFDKSAVMDDLDYFKYYFAKPHAEVVFNEQRLKGEFKAFADVVCQAYNNAFMYRDFQSRNVMVHKGKPCFIDYQGGRQGPLQYDVVSLLFQVKAQMPQTLRDELLEHYKKALSQKNNLQDIAFDKYYPYFVYISRTSAVPNPYRRNGDRQGCHDPSPGRLLRQSPTPTPNTHRSVSPTDLRYSFRLCVTPGSDGATCLPWCRLSCGWLRGTRWRRRRRYQGSHRRYP